MPRLNVRHGKPRSSNTISKIFPHFIWDIAASCVLNQIYRWRHEAELHNRLQVPVSGANKSVTGQVHQRASAQPNRRLVARSWCNSYNNVLLLSQNRLHGHEQAITLKSLHLLSKNQITHGTPLIVEPQPGAKARQLTAAATASLSDSSSTSIARPMSKPSTGITIPEPRLGVPILFPGLPFQEKGDLCYSI